MKIIKCYLIRHGITEGNNALHFNGSGTDEPLTSEGREALKEVEGVAPGSILFVSPMIRARETAAIMFPEMKPLVIDDLREMHFGIFEGKNHKMLDGEPEYQAWIDSGGTARIPEGFSRQSMEWFYRSSRNRGKQGYRNHISGRSRRNDNGCHEQPDRRRLF